MGRIRVVENHKELSDKDKDTIRLECHTGQSKVAAAKRFGVSLSTVHKVYNEQFGSRPQG